MQIAESWITSLTALTEVHKSQLELRWWCPEHAGAGKPAAAKPFSTLVGIGQRQGAYDVVDAAQAKAEYPVKVPLHGGLSPDDGTGARSEGTQSKKSVS